MDDEHTTTGRDETPSEHTQPLAPSAGVAPTRPEHTAVAPALPATAPLTTRDDTEQAASGRSTGKMWSLRTVVAAAITAVALSGAGGAALAAASNGGSDNGRAGPGGFGGPPGQTNRRLNGGIPGQTQNQVPGQPQNQVPGQAGQRPPTGVPGQPPA